MRKNTILEYRYLFLIVEVQTEAVRNTTKVYRLKNIPHSLINTPPIQRAKCHRPKIKMKKRRFLINHLCSGTTSIF